MSPAPPPHAAIPWHGRLEARVLVSVTFVAGVALFAMLAVTSRLVTNYSVERSRSDLLAAREAFRRLVDTRTEFASSEVRLITELPVFREHMTKLQTHTPTMDGMVEHYCGKLNADFCIVTNAEGRWIGRAGALGAGDSAALAAAIDPVHEGRSTSGIFTWSEHLVLTVSEPASFGSETIGSFTAAFELNDDVAKELALAARCDVTFVCGDGRICGSSLPQDEHEAVVTMLAEPAASGVAPALREIGDAAYVGSVSSLGESNARLVLLQDFEPTRRTLGQLHTALLWVGVATFGVAVGGMLVFGRRLTRPLRDLADAANDVASGNWTRRVPVNGPAEGRVMAEAFNQMTVALREREEQLHQAQKMEAIGRLAGGVAHDFNNLLTGIIGYAELLLQDMPPDHPMRADVEGIHKAGRSAAALTRDLLAFSRKQVLQPVVLDLNDVVTGIEHLLRRLLGEDITLQLRLAANLDQVKADRAQVEQVLLNLAVNSRDAMPGGGRLLIETENAVGTRDDIAAHLSGASGRHVVLRVRDTGQGMTPEVQARLFEPFFTTKELGKGTGLGLSTVYGVIKQSAGFIWADSTVGKGSTFTIALPAIRGVATATATIDPHQRTAGGSETVLLVEDNDAARDLARDALKRYGYNVIEAKNGVEALRIATAELDRISLVLTDLVMPLMGGRELAARLSERRQGVKVIFTSGYPADTLGPHGALERGAVFIQKPFSPAALGQTVRDVLDRVAS